MIKQEEVTSMVNRYFCDDCGKQISSLRKCCMCHKDLCGGCQILHRWEGDHAVIYCKDCLRIGEPYLRQLSLLQTKYELDSEVLEIEWREKIAKRKAEEGK